MKKYLIYGPSGVGKTAIGDELARRGYRVIEADSEISSWVNKNTGKKAAHSPPFTQDWLDEHQWVWDEEKLHKLLQDDSSVVFLIGGAHNMEKFMDLFDKKFIMYADFKTVLPRLKQREPNRWLDGSPEVKQLQTVLHNYRVVPLSDTTFIKNDGSIPAVADQIVKLTQTES